MSFCIWKQRRIVINFARLENECLELSHLLLIGLHFFNKTIVEAMEKAK